VLSTRNWQSRAMRKSHLPPVLLAVVVGASACSSSSSERSTTPVRAETPSAVGEAPTGRRATTSPSASPLGGCDAAPFSGSTTEVLGVSANVSVYGLLFPTHEGPIRQGDDLKIVWRMTGEGDLAVSYTTPDDQPRELVFGPERHDGGTYDRPGDEWGTGFRFDQPGCWHIHLQRTVGARDVWLNVAARER
jgi:hypothetical protein